MFVEFLLNLDSRFFHLSNGIPVHIISGGTQEVMRIELVFRAGSWYQPAKSVATTTNFLIPNGTASRSADEISEYFDFYGSYLETNTGKDNAYLTLYTLNKHYKNTLPLLAEVLMDAVFPEQEVEIYKKNKHQSLAVNMQKVKYLARTHFNEQLFGSNHPYGKRLLFEDIDRLEQSQFQQFHRQFYRPENCMIFVSGVIHDELEQDLEKYLGPFRGNGTILPFVPSYHSASSKDRKQLISKPDVTQSAVRIGMPTINRTHPDYQGLFVLNTVLGGYFGSRLMTNIREDKGYTYGINSMLASLQHSGAWMIASEVGAGVREKAVKEIYKEIRKLRRIPVSADELDLVKNYLLGALMRSMDGPFAVAERLRSAIEYGQNKDYYLQYANTIRQITAERLHQLANQYFDEKTFFETVAGV